MVSTSLGVQVACGSMISSSGPKTGTQQVRPCVADVAVALPSAVCAPPVDLCPELVGAVGARCHNKFERCLQNSSTRLCKAAPDQDGRQPDGKHAQRSRHETGSSETYLTLSLQSKQLRHTICEGQNLQGRQAVSRGGRRPASKHSSQCSWQFHIVPHGTCQDMSTV